MMRGTLYIMSGPSGTGKGTICAELVKIEKMYLSISSTTREKRAGETDGVTYNYTTVESFEEMIKNGEMLEYAKYGDNYYGTPKKYIEEQLSNGVDVMLEIEPQGALQVKKIYPDAVMIFILPPSMAELKRRLTDRGRENEEQINERLQNAKWEFSQAPFYNRIFINDNLDECVESVRQFMHKTDGRLEFLNKLLNEEY